MPSLILPMPGTTANENWYSLNTANEELDIPFVKGLYVDGFCLLILESAAIKTGINHTRFIPTIL